MSLIIFQTVGMFVVLEQSNPKLKHKYKTKFSFLDLII